MDSLGQSPTSLARELTAREIFNRIVKGQVVRIPNDPVAAQQLKNHLNVIKSREKRIFADLGLDFLSSVVSVLSTPEQDAFEVKLIAPKKRRKYTTFLINHEPSPVQR